MGADAGGQFRQIKRLYHIVIGPGIQPGDTVEVEFVRRGGERVRGTLTFDEDPRVEVVTFEAAGQAVSAEQLAFREAWLGRR